MKLLDRHPSFERTAPGTGTEVLFPEAKQRERRRRVIMAAAVLAAVGLAVGLIESFGGAPPRLASKTSQAAEGGSPFAVVARAVLKGNGIGTAHFGQPEAVAIADLDKMLGSPRNARPAHLSGYCNVDSYVQWRTIAAYFYRDLFVGFTTGSVTRARLPNPNTATTAGLRVGDTLARARKIYATAFRTSTAQGGSWIATTSLGRLAGFLTDVPHASDSRIASIEAGAVGCPALSP